MCNVQAVIIVYVAVNLNKLLLESAVVFIWKTMFAKHIALNNFSLEWLTYWSIFCQPC